MNSLVPIGAARRPAHGLIQAIQTRFGCSAGAQIPITEDNCGILLHSIPGTGKSALAKLLPDAIEAERGGMSAGEMYVRVQPGANGLEMGNRVANAAMMMPFAVCRLPLARRILAHAGVSGGCDAQLAAVITPCAGSVRQIPDQRAIYRVSRNLYRRDLSRKRCRCRIGPSRTSPEGWRGCPPCERTS